MRRDSMAIALAAILLFPSGCATEGAVDVGVGFYGGYWDDPWYSSGCCVDPPDNIGPPPHPAHPIANPPDLKPTQPIANPPTATPKSTPSPRPAMRSGGGGGRGGRR